MQELINIVVNVLQSTENGGSVRFTKNSDSEFLFEGEGTDAKGQQYNYKINVEFSLKKPETTEEKEQQVNELKEALKKEEKE